MKPSLGHCDDMASHPKLFSLFHKILSNNWDFFFQSLCDFRSELLRKVEVTIVLPNWSVCGKVNQHCSIKGWCRFCRRTVRGILVTPAGRWIVGRRYSTHILCSVSCQWPWVLHIVERLDWSTGDLWMNVIYECNLNRIASLQSHHTIYEDTLS